MTILSSGLALFVIQARKYTTCSETGAKVAKSDKECQIVSSLPSTIVNLLTNCDYDDDPLFLMHVLVYLSCIYHYGESTYLLLNIAIFLEQNYLLSIGRKKLSKYKRNSFHVEGDGSHLSTFSPVELTAGCVLSIFLHIFHPSPFMLWTSPREINLNSAKAT